MPSARRSCAGAPVDPRARTLAARRDPSGRRPARVRSAPRSSRVSRTSSGACRALADPQDGFDRAVCVVARRELVEQAADLVAVHAALDEAVDETADQAAPPGGPSAEREARSMRFAGRVEVPPFERSTPCAGRGARPRARGERRRSGDRRRRAPPGNGRPARGGSRRSRPARRARRSRRASRRTARGGPRAPPSGAPRTPCRGSGGAGSERRRLRGSPRGRAGRPPCGRATGAGRRRRPAASPARAPSRRRGGRPAPRRRRARSRRAPSWFERVEPCLEERLDRRRHVDRAVRFTGEGRHLLEEERVPLGGRQDPRPRLGVELDARRAARLPAGAPPTSASGSSRTDVALSFPPRPARPARRAAPGRAMQRRRIGASRDQSATCSTRSSIGGSAQWRSSSTSTSGRSAAALLEQRARRELRLGGRGPDRL